MNKIIYYAVFVLLLVCFSACARKMTFARSVVVPAAEGRVKIKKDKNDNYAIDVSVRNLAEARNLRPPKQTYVVWMQTRDDGTKNIGQLNSSSGFLSKKLKGSLSTVSSHRPTSFFITAEDVGDVQHPGPQTVLVTER